MAAQGRLAVGFAWAGHSLMHIVAGLYLTVVLALEDAWARPYDDLIRLWTLGALMIGLGAPVAGWLGDRWGHGRMLAVFFLVTGAGSIGAGLADGDTGLWLALAVLGLGASVYHPVAMAWVVQNAVNRGQAMGYWGVFGSLGTTTAALIAGTLSELIHWRAAFLIPGALCLILGIALTACLLTRRVIDRAGDVQPQAAASRRDTIRAFLILTLTMFCGGLIWHSLQVLLPKWFEAGVGDWVGGGTLGIGGLVTAVYLMAALPQIAGGHLADRTSPKFVYVLCLCIQMPLLLLAAQIAGPAIVPVAFFMLMAVTIQLPAENLLLARYAPSKHRGFTFGAKFVVMFGVGPVAVELAAWVYGQTGSFALLFLGLSGLAAVAVAAASLLPREHRDRPVMSDDAAQPVPVPATGGAD